METRKSARQVKTGKCINARRTSSEALVQGTGLCSTRLLCLAASVDAWTNVY